MKGTTLRLVVACTCVVLAACGTRAPEEAFLQTGQQVAIEAGQQSGTFDDSTGFDAGDGISAGSTDGDLVTGAATEGASDPSAQAPGSGGSQQATTGGGGGGAGGGGGGAPGVNEASDVGVTETSVRIGAIVAENGVLGDAFAPTARGMRAWAANINAQGGIAGRQVELFTCDDREDRARSLQCAKRLVEQDEVFALVGTNTRAFGGASPYLAEVGIPVIGTPINNAFYRWDNFFSLYGGPYNRDGNEVGHEDQLRSTTTVYRWFYEEMGLRKAAVVAYDIAESAQAGEFIAKGLELEGFQVDLYTVSFAAPSFDQVVADMERKGVEMVFDAMDDGANRRFCDTISRRNYKGLKAKVSTVVVMGQNLGSNYPDVCRNVVFIPGSTLAYSQTSNAVVKEFRDAFARYQPGQPLHQWAFEGYLHGELFKELMIQMGTTPTRKELIDELNSRGPFMVSGVLINGGYIEGDFSKERVENCSSINRWQDSKGGWTPAVQFPLCYPDAIQYFTPVGERGD